jgi:hypothetical protein
VLSKSEQAYRALKRDVVERTVDVNNLLTPVIHPVIDYGDGLANMRNLLQKIPVLNPFCDFKSSVPILYKNDLEKFIRSLCGPMNEERRDVYSCELYISDIFRVDKKVDVFWLSFILRKILSVFTFVPKVSLLLNGRSIS